MQLSCNIGEARTPPRWDGSRGRLAVPGGRHRNGRHRSRRATWGSTTHSTTITLLCVVGLVLMGRVAIAAHMLIVPHEVSGNGLLVHHRHKASQRVTEASRQIAPLPGVTTGDDDKREYCEVMGLNETQPSVTSPTMSPRLLPWFLARVSPPPTVWAAGLPLLLLAPKQSPPRV